MFLRGRMSLDGNRCACRRGLTLLELVVVLAILVAVTSLVVPMLPNMVHRANIASCTTNISEIDKLVQTFQSMYALYPDRMDNLVVGSALATYVLDGSNGQYTQASFTAGALQTEEAQALTAAGVTQVATLVENAGGDWKPTAWPYSSSQATGPTLATVDNKLSVAVLTQFGTQLMGLPTADGERYVIFGLNRPCTLFRNMATEPPYHYADTPSEDPATYYMCFGAVFLVSKSSTQGQNTVLQPLQQARFMGSVAFHDFGLATADSHTKEWWDQLKTDRPLQ